MLKMQLKHTEVTKQATLSVARGFRMRCFTLSEADNRSDNGDHLWPPLDPSKKLHFER